MFSSTSPQSRVYVFAVSPAFVIVPVAVTVMASPAARPVIVVSALLIYCRAGRKGFQPIFSRKHWKCFGGYGLSAGAAEFLSMTAMISLPASIQFSLVSGGVIACSTVISILRRERQSVKTVLSVLLALAALIVVGL